MSISLILDKWQNNSCKPFVFYLLRWLFIKSNIYSNPSFFYRDRKCILELQTCVLVNCNS